MHQAPLDAREGRLNDLPLSIGTSRSIYCGLEPLLVKKQLSPLVVIGSSALRAAEELRTALGARRSGQADRVWATRVQTQELFERLNGGRPLAGYVGHAGLARRDGGVDALRHGRWLSFGRAGQTLSPSVGGTRPVQWRAGQTRCLDDNGTHPLCHESRVGEAVRLDA